MKRCGKCKKIKSVDQFHVDNNKVSGLAYQCKKCKSQYDKTYRENDRVKRAKNKAWLKFRYGISVDDVKTMLVKQDNCCAICFASLDDGYHIDHCHSSDKVRGLLCMSCNVGLGHFQDDPHLMRLAANYLEKGSINEFDDTAKKFFG